MYESDLLPYINRARTNTYTLLRWTDLHITIAIMMIIIAGCFFGFSLYNFAIGIANIDKLYKCSFSKLTIQIWMIVFSPLLITSGLGTNILYVNHIVTKLRTNKYIIHLLYILSVALCMWSVIGILSFIVFCNETNEIFISAQIESIIGCIFSIIQMIILIYIK